MLFWHLGGAVFLFRALFKDSGADLRFVAAGAVLPDAVDAIIGLLPHSERLVTGRSYGHALVFALAVLVVGMWVTDRRTGNRRRAVAAAVGIMFHLLLDLMWLMPEVLLWPLAGGGLLEGGPGDWSGLPASLFGNPVRMAQEAGGLAYLIRLGHRAGLADPGRRSRLWRTGTISIARG